MGIKTKKVKWINKKTMIATFDIGKNVHYGYFKAPDGRERKPFSFHNTQKSFKQLWADIFQFKQEQNLEQIVPATLRIRPTKKIHG